MKIQTALNHISGSPDKETGAIITPLHLSTVFAMAEPSTDEGFQYGRVGNPTREVLERTLANTHTAKFAHAFSSGSSALTTLLLTLKPGDKIICHDEGYEGTSRILKTVFEKLGIKTIFLDLRQTTKFSHALKKRIKFVFLETPTNPFLTLLNIKKIVNLSHDTATLVVIDNTFATPILQKPLSLGADIVLESLTKALNGHSDIMGGMLATNNEELSNDIKTIKNTIGSALSPFECFLTLRGMKTLDIRIKKQQQSARGISKFLLSHKSIHKVFFPELLQPILTKQQMRGPGFIISFLTKGDPHLFITSLQLITIGHSFGGTETLIQQPRVMMNLSRDIPNNLFRLSIGLENVKDLKKDLDSALTKAQSFV